MYGPCSDVSEWTDGNLYDNVTAALDRGWERWADTPFIVQRNDGAVDLMYQRGDRWNGRAYKEGKLESKWLNLLRIDEKEVVLFAFPEEKYANKLVNAVTRLLLPYQLERGGANWWLVPPFVGNQHSDHSAGKLAYKFREEIRFPTSLLKDSEDTVADFNTFIEMQQGADNFRTMHGNHQSYGLKETTHTIGDWGLVTFGLPDSDSTTWMKERYEKLKVVDSVKLTNNQIIASHIRHLCGPKRGKGTRRVRNVVLRAKDTVGVQHVYCGLCGAEPNHDEMDQLKFTAELAGMGLEI